MGSLGHRRIYSLWWFQFNFIEGQPLIKEFIHGSPMRLARSLHFSPEKSELCIFLYDCFVWSKLCILLALVIFAGFADQLGAQKIFTE